MQNGSTNQSGEILATRSGFVPTAAGACGAKHPTSEVDWQTAMKRAVRSSRQLREILDLPSWPEDANAVLEGERSFPTFVPWEFLARIEPGNPADPLLRQVMPMPQEQTERAGFCSDPVGDLGAQVAGGILHKYHGRALVIATGACGVHCRYCFRRQFPYSSAGARSQHWHPSIEYLRSHRELDEVVLSGGDPLTLTDHKLDELIGMIEATEHVRRLRIHTRMPIVIPQRVTPELTQRLAGSRLAVWLVVHANHPNELDSNVLDRLAAMIESGIPVLNQAVLLRGVNDDAETLIELCRKLVDHRIGPYYLHQLDRVRGAWHFEVPVDQGRRLMKRLRDSLPGYAVPNYVVEQAGEASKTPLA